MLAEKHVMNTPPKAKLHEGVWLPEHEEHLVKMMTPGAKRFDRLPDGRAAYQRHKYLQALKYVPDPKVFVDVGAHVGLWSMQAAFHFDQIIAFEPHEHHARIYSHNMGDVKGWALHQVALGSLFGYVGLQTSKTSSGDTYVCGDGNIPMHTIDYHDIPRIDLMKIDTEGYELPILQGAVETLKRCRPVIVVEQKGRDAMYHKGTNGEAVRFLKAIGMVELCSPISGDYFMGWPK